MNLDYTWELQLMVEQLNTKLLELSTAQVVLPKPKSSMRNRSNVTTPTSG